MRENRKAWTDKQDKTLIGLVKIYGHQWTNLCLQLNETFNSKRTPQQCKQRYLNNFDKNVNRSPWEKQQIKQLFQEYKKQQCQWIKISQNLKTQRTDIAVKNKFYSAIRRSLRRMIKLLGGNNSTEIVNDIKPKQLTTKLKSLQQGLQNLYQILFDFSDAKVQDLKDLMNNKQYSQKIQKIVDNFVKGSENIIIINNTKSQTRSQKPNAKNKQQQQEEEKQSIQQEMSNQDQKVQQTQEEPENKNTNIFNKVLEQSMQVQNQQNEDERDLQNKKKIAAEFHSLLKNDDQEMNDQGVNTNSLNKMLESSQNYKLTQQVPVNIPLSQSGNCFLQYDPIKYLTNSMNSLNISSNGKDNEKQ